MASIWPEPVSEQVLCGWGRTAPTGATVAHPAFDHELVASVTDIPARGVIARGLGRSYGDAAQNAGGRVVDTTAMAGIELDPRTGTVTAQAGASLDLLMRLLVPRGFFVPVTPGTRHVTVGGAVAADIHGKDHHLTGSWCDHVERIGLLLANGQRVEVGPDRDAELFWATAGGLGLTGVVVDATFRCRPIETSRLLVDTDRCEDLDEVMRLLVEGEQRYDYSVAWIDLVATGRAMGRSVLTQGRFATLDELPEPARATPLAFHPRELLAAPPWVPEGLLNRWSIIAFNELWYRKAPARRRDELQGITEFFHPLDLVRGWNRMYGRPGFLQWQVVVPDGAEATLRHAVERLSSSRCSSFLAVLKRFGPGNAGPLSFPMPGWTLALDIPVSAGPLATLLDELDEQVAAAGGRVYLAKDSRMRAELLPIMYPRLDEWRSVRQRVDPDQRLRSDLARRLAL